MRWCWWRCWWRLPSPRWESCWWWWWRWFPPPGGKFPRRNRSAGGQKCSCPSSASRRRLFVPKVLLLIFLGQNDLYTRRWAPEVGRGGHNPPGRAWASWRAQVGCAHLVGPLCYLLTPIFLIYSIKYLHKVSACLELCRRSFSRSRFPAAGILPLGVYLAYYERKGIRITPKSIIMDKNIINDSR